MEDILQSDVQVIVMIPLLCKDTFPRVELIGIYYFVLGYGLQNTKSVNKTKRCETHLKYNV